ncbi:uncharacterized protein IUM83_05711 [Phytophthora cinnamomi]|uniref:uncharacterized protein n=1 Tax=Phytophthora cinnamomi TaxID=4785 RepID=UPI003559F81F|nr:hypothetical protein IUM83_05711 [Phytophthora cinnamomi]
MASIASPSLSTKLHQPTAAPFRSLLDKIMGRNSSTATKNLPRKLASNPCAASLLSGPLPLDEVNRRRLQLQRVVDVVVLDATRDSKGEVVITLNLTLRPEAPRQQVGIFVPNNAAEGFELSKTFHDVNQLGRVLTFCIDNSEGECGQDCEFCAELRTYLHTHYVRDPLVNVVNMGGTVLRRPALAMHLARLVTFATGKSIVPRVVTTPNDKGVLLTSHLAPLGRQKETTKSASVCAVQNELAAVLYDFFDAFRAD